MLTAESGYESVYVCMSNLRRVFKWPIRVPLVIIAIISLAAIIWKSAGYRDHQWLLDRMPLGAEVRDLEPLLNEESVRGSAAIETQRKKGVIHQVELGDFHALRHSRIDESKFTGKIILFVEEPFSDSIGLWFIYVDGRLVDKQWGFLPG